MHLCYTPLFLRDKEKIIFTTPAGIVRVEAARNSVNVVLEDGTQMLVNMTMAACQDLLMPFGIFYRAHHQTLLNFMHCHTCTLADQTITLRLPDTHPVKCSHTGMKRLKKITAPPATGQLQLDFGSQ